MEACIIMGILAPKAGRNIVRALKALLGPWCLAQADSHSDTAKNAGAAFRDTFPGPKAREAIALFRNQVCFRSCSSHAADWVTSARGGPGLGSSAECSKECTRSKGKAIALQVWP